MTSYCYGCENDIDNQQGHYGGCIKEFSDDENVEEYIVTNKGKALSACDNCSREFYAGDSLYIQTGDTIHDLFKLEFCSDVCYDNCKTMYPFVREFHFKETVKQIVNKNTDIILELLNNHTRFVFDYTNRNPYNALKIISDFVELKKKDSLDEEESEYIKFCEDKELFVLD